MMNIKTFVFNPFMENTYLIWDDESKEGAVIDPGCNSTNEEASLKDFILQNDVKLKYLFNTHAHVDHVLGNAFIKEQYDCEFWGGEKDNFILEMLPDICSNYGIPVKSSPLPDIYFDEEVKLFLGKIEIVPIFTPGHSPGEFCLYISSENVCFTGDVLFNNGIGRTDLWGGSYETLIESINSRLLTLPEDTIIYPGHGEKSSIISEKENNQWL